MRGKRTKKEMFAVLRKILLEVKQYQTDYMPYNLAEICKRERTAMLLRPWIGDLRNVEIDNKVVMNLYKTYTAYNQHTRRIKSQKTLFDEIEPLDNEWERKRFTLICNMVRSASVINETAADNIVRAADRIISKLRQ